MEKNPEEIGAWVKASHFAGDTEKTKQSVTIFLIAASLIENPLLYLRANNPD